MHVNVKTLDAGLKHVQIMPWGCMGGFRIMTSLTEVIFQNNEDLYLVFILGMFVLLKEGSKENYVKSYT